MLQLYCNQLKTLTLGLGYSTFSSQTKRLVLQHLKPSHFSLQNELLCKPISSKVSSGQHDFTVNYFINSCGLSPEGAILASKSVELQSRERPDSILALLRSHGFSEIQISKLVRSRPHLLLADPEQTLLPKLEFFSSLGVSRQDNAKTLASNPTLLEMSLQKRIIPTYDFLRSLLSEKNVVAVFKRCSRLFLVGHSKNVVPNIGRLRELGMPESCISLLLAHFTHALMQKPKKFGEVVDEVKQLGFNLEKTTSVMAISALCGKNSELLWNQNREIYKRWGWSEEDVVCAFRKSPKCMVLSEKKIMQAMEFLINEIGLPSGMIAKAPMIVCYSLEKRVIPRCSVVKVLWLKGLINANLSLATAMLPAEEQFLERFVTRYLNEVPQLSSVYQGKVAIQDV